MRAIRKIVIHRIRVDHVGFAESAVGVERFFAEHRDGKRATGGRMPYHYVIEPAGRVVHTVVLSEPAPHAAAHNEDSIGIGVYGDFRTCDPTYAQVVSLITLCARLRSIYRRAKIVRHDALDGGSSARGKVCPGGHLPVEDIVRLADEIHKLTKNL